MARKKKLSKRQKRLKAQKESLCKVRIIHILEDNRKLYVTEKGMILEIERKDVSLTYPKLRYTDDLDSYFTSDLDFGVKIQEQILEPITMPIDLDAFVFGGITVRELLSIPKKQRKEDYLKWKEQLSDTLDNLGFKVSQEGKNKTVFSKKKYLN